MAADTYLASFPRSGNTWVRFLIANVYNNLKRDCPEVDFFNVHDIVPELKKSGMSGEPRFRDLPRVIKTHAPFREPFARAIYLVRNPYDVLFSYWNFLNANRGLDLSLADTARHETYGISALVEHVDSYVRRCPSLLILTYESLLDRTGYELERICDFIGVAVDAETVEEAVRNSTFETMRDIETRKGRKFGRPDFRFVRCGSRGEGEAAIRRDPATHRRVQDALKAAPLLGLLYG
jgi:hypothetical protein